MKKTILLIMFSSLVLASDSSVETDIVQRSINFVLFAVILYKIAFKPLSALLNQRTKDIQHELESFDLELEDSRKSKEEAISSIETAKKRAKDVKKSIAAEAKNISKKIEIETEQELESLIKLFESKKEIEEKKLKTFLIKEITSEIFVDGSITPTNDEIANVIIKKVG